MNELRKKKKKKKKLLDCEFRQRSRAIVNKKQTKKKDNKKEKLLWIPNF